VLLTKGLAMSSRLIGHESAGVEAASGPACHRSGADQRPHPDSEQIDRPCDWVVCDASFIALSKVLEVPLRLAAPVCRLVALIKPQFEVGRAEVGSKGVVRDPALHARLRGGAGLGGRLGLYRGWYRGKPDHRAGGMWNSDRGASRLTDGRGLCLCDQTQARG
jgi:hypothetical protein